MQILKPEIRELILKNATNEFYEKGYKNSSLRKIAANSSLTVGNLYRYFKNKADLFREVVTPAIEMLKGFTEHEMHDYSVLPKKELNKIISSEVEKLADLFIQFRKELLILMKGSSGTEFQNSKILIINHFTEHVKEHFEAEEIDFSQPGIKQFPETISASYLEALLYILENSYEDNELREGLKFYTLYLINSFINFIQQEKKK